MPFLSVREETYKALRLLRQEGESEDALIQRVVELARCYMVLEGMEDTGRGEGPNGLREIAVRVFHSNHCNCLKVFADAYLKADKENEKILRPAWLVLIEKYRLDKELKP